MTTKKTKPAPITHADVAEVMRQRGYAADAVRKTLKVSGLQVPLSITDAGISLGATYKESEGERWVYGRPRHWSHATPAVYEAVQEWVEQTLRMREHQRAASANKKAAAKLLRAAAALGIDARWVAYNQHVALDIPVEEFKKLVAALKAGGYRPD